MFNVRISADFGLYFGSLLRSSVFNLTFLLAHEPNGEEIGEDWWGGHLRGLTDNRCSCKLPDISGVGREPRDEEEGESDEGERMQ